jgi:hypothetical protein
MVIVENLLLFYFRDSIIFYDLAINMSVNYSEVYIVSDQPATCPKCGSRTEITLDLFNTLEQTQHHKCLSSNCSFEFVMQNDDEK